MSRFKIDDVVVCIYDDGAGSLKVGCKYIVLDVDEDGDIFISNEYNYAFFKNRFILDEVATRNEKIKNILE